VLTPDLDFIFPDPQFFGFWARHLAPVWAAVYLVGARVGPTWRGYRFVLSLTARVAAPDTPAVLPVSPEVTDHKQSAPVLAQHSGPHVNLAEDRCHIARPVDPLLLDAVGVHDVVLKNLQPSGSRHRGGLRMHQDQGVVLVQNPFGQGALALLNRVVETPHRGGQIVGCHTQILPSAQQQ